MSHCSEPGEYWVFHIIKFKTLRLILVKSQSIVSQYQYSSNILLDKLTAPLTSEFIGAW